MNTILITGINGFVGSSLAKKLSEEFTIIGLESCTDNLFRLKDTDFEIYSSENDLAMIFQDNPIDIIIHTATIYRRVNDSVADLLKTNVLQPVLLYELANRNNVSYFINTDTFFNNNNSTYSYLGEYTLSKRHLVEWLKVLHLRTRIINMKLFHLYGPGDAQTKFVTKMINDLMSNIPKIELTNGKQMRDFIFIDDVVEAYYTIIKNLDKQKKAFTEYEVGTGKPHSIREFVTLAAQKTNSSTELLFGAISLRDGEIMESIADNRNLLELGWKSNTDIHIGISKIISSMRKI